MTSKAFPLFAGECANSALINARLRALLRQALFDSLGGKRAQYIAVMEEVMDRAAADYRKGAIGQVSLFGDDDAQKDELPDIEEFSRSTLLSFEKKQHRRVCFRSPS